MEESELNTLKSDDVGKSRLILLKFNEKNLQTFKFPELNQGDKRKALWSTLFQVLENPDLGNLHKDCLASVRILSRDQTQLDAVVTPEIINCLLRHAGLVSREEALNRVNEPVVDYEVMLEAVKCLCNLIFNSAAAQQICSENHAVEGIVLRLRTYRDSTLPDEIKYFDMKMLFIITALCPKVRPALKEDFHGFIYLMETLGLLLNLTGDDGLGATSSQGTILVLSDDEISLTCEILKVLYNITIPGTSSQSKSTDKENINGEEDPQCTRLVSILHDLLLCQAHTDAKRMEFVSHTINLLTNMPNQSLKGLITPSGGKSTSGNGNDDFEGYNMKAFKVILEFLTKRIDADDGVKEPSTPVLTLLLRCARNHRILRRYLKTFVLPPLTEKDSRIRPEQGANLRGFFCRQLTSVDTRVAELVADLIFVLCKESLGRMIKYTGYGNAAGLFAKRGLLGGKNPDSTNNYSSDSEDSDTEEYKKFRDLVNPVTGCIEPPHTNPLEGMTEEQKEYEAMKLANLMSKLAETGVVQPARIGADGRPEPIEHVLQLQEEMLKKKGGNVEENGSDSE